MKARITGTNKNENGIIDFYAKGCAILSRYYFNTGSDPYYSPKINMAIFFNPDLELNIFKIIHRFCAADFGCKYYAYPMEDSGGIIVSVYKDPKGLSEPILISGQFSEKDLYDSSIYICYLSEWVNDMSKMSQEFPEDEETVKEFLNQVTDLDAKPPKCMITMKRRIKKRIKFFIPDTD